MCCAWYKVTVVSENLLLPSSGRFFRSPMNVDTVDWIHIHFETKEVLCSQQLIRTRGVGFGRQEKQEPLHSIT
jgi:hypothetical protein